VAPWAPLAVLALLARVASGADPGPAMDRYMDVYEKIKKGPKMRMEAASFFGGAGHEEFVGVTGLPEGRVLAVGNSWGPPFPTEPEATVLGVDRLWDMPLYPASYRSGTAANVPADDHPNRTGFLAVFSPRLEKVERIARFGWGSASIARVLRMRDGALVFAGRAWRPLTDFPCPASGFHDFASTNLSLSNRGRNDSYVAKLAPDGRTFEWVWNLLGQDEPPRGLYEGADKEVIVRQPFEVLRISGDGSAIRDFFGTDLGKVGPWYMRAANDKDGTLLVGGGWMTSTGREPWREPWLKLFDPVGKHLATYYAWSGPLVGHDDYRLVSDSSVDIVTPLADGRIAIAGKSDGGNSVFARHPADLDYEAGCALPFSLWGAGAGTFFTIAAFDPLNPQDVVRTIWCSYRSGSPSNTRILSLSGMEDGCIVVTGIANDWLVQTTQAHFRDHFHYLNRGRLPSPDDWPVWLGLGGTGHYIAVLTPKLDRVLWASAMPCSEHTGVVAVPGGLVVVARCTGIDARDGRSPALYCFNSMLLNDIRNWPGMVRKLVASAGGAATPVQRIWTRLSAKTRDMAGTWVKGAVKNEAIPQALRTALIEDLDELLFDARDLYDAAVWTEPGFDAGEEATIRKLKTHPAAVTRDELGYVNRRLLEKALPDHVFVVPRPNRLLAMKGAQMEYGGGPGDGYIYFLRAAPWRSADLIAQAATTLPSIELATTNAPAIRVTPLQAKGGSWAKARDVNGVLTPLYGAAAQGKVSGYCTTYAICRSPERRRPLFHHGWAGKGDLKFHFTRNVLESRSFAVKTTGGVTLDLEADNEKGEDVAVFAASDWLRDPSTPSLRIAIHGFKDWKEHGENGVVLFDPDRGGRAREDEAMSAAYTAKADMDVAGGGRTTQLKDVPVAVRVFDKVTKWSIRFDFAVELPPSKVDLTASVPVRMKVTHESFCLPPANQGAPALDALELP
jgi:hypothetical protein